MSIDTYTITPSEDGAQPIPSEKSKQATPAPEAVALFEQCLQHPRKDPKFSRKEASGDHFTKVLGTKPSVNTSLKLVVSREAPVSREEHRHPIEDKRSRSLGANQTHAPVVPLEVVTHMHELNATPVQTNEVTASQPIETHVHEVMRYIKEQVISRVLVASSSLEQNRSVILTLSPDLLADTNVQFSKSGSSLHIQFTSQAQSSLSFLTENQVNLQGYLQTELKPYKYEHVSVQVFDGRLSEGSMSKDSRSRGYFAYDAQEDTK